MVPVNLRSLYPSRTMRNFVTFVRIIFLPSSCKSVEDCAKEAYRQLKIETAKDKLDAFISTTVRAQKTGFSKRCHSSSRPRLYDSANCLCALVRR